MTNNITRKRRFIIDFVYPHGQEVCANLGLVPASQDIADKEAQTSLHRNRALYNSPIEERVQIMATWAVEVITSGSGLPVPPELAERLRASLIEFHRASISSLLDDGLINIQGVEVEDT